MAVKDLTIEQYREEFVAKQSFQLIDVREIVEWEDARLPDTVNIPMSEFQARMDEIENDTPIVLVCRSGARSNMAGEFLVANGYDNVFNLLEGTMGWQRRDLPTEQG